MLRECWFLSFCLFTFPLSDSVLSFFSVNYLLSSFMAASASPLFLAASAVFLHGCYDCGVPCVFFFLPSSYLFRVFLALCPFLVAVSRTVGFYLDMLFLCYYLLNFLQLMF